ncbi:MAG TPA: Gfo/Idh/MocA family oxidoreductase [Candidatus Hydrogenedens sp.]|nr:Gfo/Idh/MocA family oxidoreductase [Candidatus Hydrogenedens sp.]HOK09860.1 Gfo/Idh/MocA family oxidoreductase [Candidatus Hydrogenedens sp.]HOL19524.1 Gfo/Idh/MocA family oxidoreductase [Candidatus Hydrogenedens sp.]HPP59372.1 Gfo/Idh/MocA family oxidoreductase [Candidatus Hydrogenedens sp.]
MQSLGFHLFFVACLIVLSMSFCGQAQDTSQAPPLQETDKELNIGLVGLDTSHVITFAQIYNDMNNPKRVPGARIILGYPGGSPDLEASSSRVAGFTERLKKEFGVEIVNSIEELCSRVDAVMLTSVDGRVHLEQVKPIFEAKKRVFIDKPLAGSLTDAIKIAKLAKEHNVPWFTSSSYRFYKGLTQMLKQDIGPIHTAISYGPCHLEPHHPDLFWYGIHPTEALYTVLGRGCETVTRVSTADTDVVTGVWKDGRVGVLVGLRKGDLPHQVIAFGEKGTARQEEDSDFSPLAEEIVKFFRTGVPPVDPEESIEMFLFMESADESKRQGGKPIRLEEVLANAEKQIAEGK